MCPLSKVSKAKVTNALKITRIERARTEKQLKEVKSKLKEELVDVSDVAHQKMKDLVDSAEKDSFTALFSEEQKKSFSRRSGGMRWHPMMVRFAILLHSQSPSTYRTLREVGVLKLPAESTLRDYTNVLHPKSGFQMEVFIELKQMAEALKENERWVCLLHDEIAIKSGLVYDRRSGELVGFAHTQRTGIAEDNLATHALVFMVVGITSNIKMSIGYFPTRTATSDQIFPLLWKVVGLLECVCKLKGKPFCNNNLLSNLQCYITR